MSAEDWVGWNYPDEDDQPTETECKHCGKAGLHWEELAPGEWKLFEEHAMHHCDQKRLDRRAAADFEDLDK